MKEKGKGNERRGEGERVATCRARQSQREAREGEEGREADGEREGERVLAL